MIIKLIKDLWSWRTKCTHNDYTIVYECHTDGFIECKCSNCGETFFQSLKEEKQNFS